MSPSCSGARIALVSDRDSADLFGDGPLLLAAFEDIGITADVVPWTDDPPWASFDAALIRNTWDYVFDRDAFLEWASRVSALTRLANPVEVLRWNTDKRYLKELDAAGVPTVPTIWVEPGQPVPAVEWNEFVVKPSISAGGLLSARYRRQAQDQTVIDHVNRIHETGAAAMIQPYLASVDGEGETGTYVFGGKVSHAIRKGPILDASRPPNADLSAASIQSVEPAAGRPELEAFALQVLKAAPPVLYARVDTAPDHNGQPILLELELTEPFLFLEHAPPAAHRFAAAVAAWLQSDHIE